LPITFYLFDNRRIDQFRQYIKDEDNARDDDSKRDEQRAA